MLLVHSSMMTLLTENIYSLTLAGCCRPVRVHLREASDRVDQVQVRDLVRQVRIKAGPQRKVLREQHRPSGDKKTKHLVS
jgi:hypothetical protein